MGLLSVLASEFLCQNKSSTAYLMLGHIYHIHIYIHIYMHFNITEYPSTESLYSILEDLKRQL